MVRLASLTHHWSESRTRDHGLARACTPKCLFALTALTAVRQASGRRQAGVSARRRGDPVFEILKSKKLKLVGSKRKISVLCKKTPHR